MTAPGGMYPSWPSQQPGYQTAHPGGYPPPHDYQEPQGYQQDPYAYQQPHAYQHSADQQYAADYQYPAGYQDPYQDFNHQDPYYQDHYQQTPYPAPDQPVPDESWAPAGQVGQPAGFGSAEQDLFRRARMRTLWFGWGWMAGCVLLAVVLGLTVSGPLVVVAFPLAIGACGLACSVGVGPLPGVLWAVPLVPMVLLLQGTYPSSPGQHWGQPHWIVGVLFVALVETFAVLLRRLGGIHIRRRLDRGIQVPDAAAYRSLRRPLELRLVLYFIAALFAHIDIAALVIVACFAGLLWRRRWTSAVAALVTLLTLLLLIRDALLPGARANWAEPVIYLALTVHWVHAIFSESWQVSRLRITETVLRGVGRGAAGTYRVAERATRTALDPLIAAPFPARGGGSAGGFFAAINEPPAGGVREQYCFACVRRTMHDRWKGCLLCWEGRNGKQDAAEGRKMAYADDHTSREGRREYEREYERQRRYQER